MLHAGRIDAAFFNLPIEDDRITVHWESPVQDIFVAGQKFAELKDKPLVTTAAGKLPLIMLEHKANSRVYVQRFFLRQGVELQPEIELASYELMGELARINLGVSCMVRQFCRQELQSGKLFELSLTEPVPPRSIGMVSLKGVSLPPSVSRFVELMNETTRKQGRGKGGMTMERLTTGRLLLRAFESEDLQSLLPIVASRTPASMRTKAAREHRRKQTAVKPADAGGFDLGNL